MLCSCIQLYTRVVINLILDNIPNLVLDNIPVEFIPDRHLDAFL